MKLHSGSLILMIRQDMHLENYDEQSIKGLHSQLVCRNYLGDGFLDRGPFT